MKYIGKGVEFYVGDGTKRVGKIKKIEFDQLLGKPVFIIQTPFGNIARLTRNEISKIR